MFCNPKPSNAFLPLVCLLLLLAGQLFPDRGFSQTNDSQQPVQTIAVADVKSAAASSETHFPKIIGVEIPGAPRLAQPMVVMGSTKPVLTEKHGLAAPALWDWNRDGKRDLLIGEFETGDDESNIRVYLNVGTDSAPNFSDEFEYAKDTEGNVLTVPQW